MAAILSGLVLLAQAGDVKPRRAPALPLKHWLNTLDGQPLSIERLRGKVVLVEFWTYGWINCRNVLPAVTAWHKKYADRGLVIVGVHTPEFPPERKIENVKKAVAELGIQFPVVLDNDYSCWNRYGNEYWPAFYLINPEGNIVHTSFGEGNYERTEARIRQLLESAKSAEPADKH